MKQFLVILVIAAVLAALVYSSRQTKAAADPGPAEAEPEKKLEVLDMDAKKPFITNIPMTEADQQVDIRLVAGCKKFMLQTRPDPVTKLSQPFQFYVIKEGSYITVDQHYIQDGINLDQELLCWASCTVADQVLEVLQWT